MNTLIVVFPAERLGEGFGDVPEQLGHAGQALTAFAVVGVAGRGGAGGSAPRVVAARRTTNLLRFAFLVLLFLVLDLDLFARLQRLGVQLADDLGGGQFVGVPSMTTSALQQW